MATRFHFRLYLLAFLVLAAFGALIARLWEMQIQDLREYKSKIPGTRELTQRIPGVRGEIKDRKGRVLVTNKPSYEVIFDLRDIAASYAALNDGALPKADFEWTDNLGRKRSRRDTDIVKVVNERVVAGLEDLGLAVPYSKNSLRVHYLSSPVVPWTYRRGLEFDEFARFAEHNLGLPGVSPTVRPVRHYQYDALASHILGYVKLPEDGSAPAEERKEWDFYVGDDHGVRGIEKTRNGDLRGQPGVRTLLKNEKGVLVGEIDYQPSSPGSDVYLTIDLELQTIVEQVLRDANVGRTAAVVIDPNNGDILAMASIPSFNPNQFIPNISKEDWATINDNPTKPLNNKAVLSFPPGSTYKIPVALGGCLAGVQNNYINCTGTVLYGRKHKKCWIHNLGGAHGSIGLSEAIMRSCNSYFYQYGNNARIDNLVSAGKLLGLGERSGIDLDVESPGILPGKQWLQQVRPGLNWTTADTANMAIGQGDVLATPLQMAAVTATVANGGTYYPPCLVDRIVDPKTGRSIKRARRPPRNLADEGIEPWKIEKIRQGMRDVVNNNNGGTGKSAQIEGVINAGKTGTAQAWRRNEDGVRVKDNKAWFISFAPYDKPEVAICVLVEGGNPDIESLRFSGGGTAAPIARRITEKALALRSGNLRVRLTAIPPAAGNFRPVGRTEFADGPLVAAVPEEEPINIEPINEGSDAAIPRAIPLPAIPEAEAPSIRPTADDEDASIPRAVPLPVARPVN